MWLLNTATKNLVYFSDEDEAVDGGGYAILSHTWGSEEVTFDEMQRKEATSKLGYSKIDHTCRQACKDGLEYAWVDTCRCPAIRNPR